MVCRDSPADVLMCFRVVIPSTNVFFFCGKWKFFKNYPLRDSATVGCFTGEVFITTSLLVFEGRVQCDFDFNDSNKKGEFEGIISIKMNRNVKFA